MRSNGASDQVAGQLLRAARKRAGLTQAALATRAGVPASVLSAIERGRRQPTVPTLDWVLRTCGFTLGLLTGEATSIDWSRAGPELHGEVLVDLLGVVDMIPPRPHPALKVVRLTSTHHRA